MTPPDVWHLIAPAPFGGAETVVETLASGRHSTGRSTGALLLGASDEHLLATQLRAAGVETHCIRTAPRAYVAQADAVRSQLRNGDVLHTHGYQADVVGWLAARRGAPRPRVALVSTNHGYAGGSLRNRIYEWIDRRVLRHVDTVIAVSEGNAAKLKARGHTGAPVVVVPNGWRPRPPADRAALRARFGLPLDEPLVGWIGRMSHEKGGDLLLAALTHASGVRVALIGDGSERRALEAQASAAGVADRVHFVGAHPDAGAAAAALDVLVISSRTEGLPMVLLEAVGAGCPVVAFAVGGIPEVLSNDAGWLVPPTDVEALGRALEDATRDGAARASRAARARQVLDARFGLERWLAANESVYDTVRRRSDQGRRDRVR